MKFLKIILAIPLLFLGGWIALLALYTTVLLLAGVVGVAYEGIFGSEADRKVQTHVTIYVDANLQREGGVVTVVGIPVDPQRWLEISRATNDDKNNLAMLDPKNPKQAKVKTDDLHSGVIVSSAASIIEIYYPKDGSHTYNFLPLPKTTSISTEAPPALLQTKIVSSGSGEMTDPETNKQINWPSFAIVAIMGTKHGESWARSADYQFTNVDEKDYTQAYKITKSHTTRAMQMTEFGLKKYFSCLPPCQKPE